jgi:hypothetical protein
MFGTAHFLGFFHNLIRVAVRADLVRGACIFIFPFDVVVFASKVFHAVVVDVVGYSGACGSNIIPAQEAYVIEQRECLCGRLDFLALRRPVII